MTKWDDRFYELARHVARWSKDPTTRVGAVLVGRDRREIAVGYNGFPPGILDSEERLRDRELKRRLTQHAERNVLDNARFSAEGGVLYVTFFPCSECAKSIVSKGVSRVVCPRPVDREPWASDARVSGPTVRHAGEGRSGLRFRCGGRAWRCGTSRPGNPTVRIWSASSTACRPDCRSPRTTSRAG